MLGNGGGEKGGEPEGILLNPLLPTPQKKPPLLSRQPSVSANFLNGISFLVKPVWLWPNGFKSTFDGKSNDTKFDVIYWKLVEKQRICKFDKLLDKHLHLCSLHGKIPTNKDIFGIIRLLVSSRFK